MDNKMRYISSPLSFQENIGSRKFIELTGAGYRNKWAGAAFTVGSLSMVGMPLFSGFISKLLFAQAALVSVAVTSTAVRR